MEIIYITGLIIFLGIASIAINLCTPTIPQGMCECEECE